MSVPSRFTAIATLTFAASALLAAPASAQRRIGATVAAGYAAGLDSPVLASGRLGLHGSLWLERPSGLEFGLGGGWDSYEDRTTTTGALFLDPANNSVGTSNCAACIPGSAEQQARNAGRYLTPSIRLRARTGRVRPWASVGVGVYALRNVSRSAFLPSAGGPPRLAFSRTTTDWSPGGNLLAGLGIPVGARVTVDAVAQLHGAIQTGNDFFGGQGWATLGAGVTLR